MLRSFAGFELGTTITSVFRVKTTGFEHVPLALSWLGSVMFAEAKTSAGAPCRICAASVFEPPKEYFWPASICGKTSVRDAAAYTVICAFGAAATGPEAAARPSTRSATGIRRRIGFVPPSALDEHVGRLDERGRGHARLEPDLLDGVARDHGDEAHRLVHDHLHLRHQAVRLHLGDDPVEPVPRADVRAGAVAAEAVDLGRRDDATVARVPLDSDPAGL